MARRDVGTDRLRLARLSPAESLQNQSICNPLCTGNADIFFCRPRREVWGLQTLLQTLARFRISGGGGGHFSGEFLDEPLTRTCDKCLNLISRFTESWYHIFMFPWKRCMLWWLLRAPHPLPSRKRPPA